MPKWFELALGLEKCGKTADSLDVVYQTVDFMLRYGRFAEVDEFIAGLDAEGLSVQMILAVLVTTRPAGNEMPSRPGFFEAGWRVIESRGRDAKKLIGGLRNCPPKIG